MVKSNSSRNPEFGSARQLRRLLVRLAVAAIVALAVFYWYSQRHDARAKTAYAARIACSCHHVAGRTLDQCRDDLPANMGAVMLSEVAGEKAVKASLPFFGSDVARYRAGSGCVLDGWKD